MGITLFKNPKTNDNLTPPLRASPIRFAVIRRNGLSSNTWGVYVEKGEIYIACRDHMKSQKISLHKSGKRHIANLPDLEGSTGNRFLDEWWDPRVDNASKIEPTFNLFFPSWALCLNQETRNSDAVWNTNQIYIEGAESPLATIVSFCVTDAALKVRFRNDGESASLPLAILPTQQGEKLWVVLRRIPERNMKELRDNGIMNVNKRLATDANLVEKVKTLPNGHVMGISIGGNTSLGGKYLMHFPVDLFKKSATERLKE